MACFLRSLGETRKEQRKWGGEWGCVPGRKEGGLVRLCCAAEESRARLEMSGRWRWLRRGLDGEWPVRAVSGGGDRAEEVANGLGAPRVVSRRGDSGRRLQTEAREIARDTQ